MRPTFLIIGAAKSGTTSLSQYLAQHPDVFVTDPKEPHFMAFAGTRLDFRGPYDEEIINQRAVTSLEAYESLFAPAGAKKARGEGSVSTLYYPESSIANIRQYTPEAKLICVLRNPVDRAYSAFMYMTSLTRETETDFQRAWELEPERIEANYHHIWHYRRMGLYSEQLAPFMEAFGPQQLKVVLFDDFRRDPALSVRACCEFIGVNPDFPFEDREALVSGRPRSRFVQAFFGRPSPWKEALRKTLPRWLTYGIRDRIARLNLAREPLGEELRSRLTSYYREDIGKLEVLLQRDLSAWRQR